MIAVVTGFVPIPEHPRPEAEYRKLGERLLNTAVPHGMALCMAMEMKLTDCWLYQYLHWRGTEFTHSVSDNPKKNTPAYHVVQAQKSEFLLEAARSNTIPEVFVWIDFGIFHLRGMTDQILIDFLQRAQHEQAITIPGCWSLPYKYDDDHPCWRFCGGVMVVPRKYVIEFDTMWKAEYLRWIKKTNTLSWEVNTLARMERQGFPIFWYAADHDASMFTRYAGSGHACQGGDSLRAH
jgi:hypothetical protein